MLTVTGADRGCEESYVTRSLGAPYYDFGLGVKHRAYLSLPMRLGCKVYLSVLELDSLHYSGVRDPTHHVLDT